MENDPFTWFLIHLYVCSSSQTIKFSEGNSQDFWYKHIILDCQLPASERYPERGHVCQCVQVATPTFQIEFSLSDRTPCTLKFHGLWIFLYHFSQELDHDLRLNIPTLRALGGRGWCGYSGSLEPLGTWFSPTKRKEFHEKSPNPFRILPHVDSKDPLNFLIYMIHFFYQLPVSDLVGVFEHILFPYIGNFISSQVTDSYFFNH